MAKLLLSDADDPKDIRLKDGYVLFWGGYPSNWYASKFVVDGVSYNCMEQFMMAEKARAFDDQETLKKILKARYPKAQKELGREVRGYDDVIWTSSRVEIVLRGTVEKYRQNEQILQRLLSTGDARFVECSPYDTIWGIGLPMTSKHATNPAKWRGQNLLGECITRARTILRAG